MSDGQHEGPEVDLSVLNDDQRSGVTCITCGTPGGPMRPIVTPRNRDSTMVFVHTDATCACAVWHGTSPSCTCAWSASRRTPPRLSRGPWTWTDRDECPVDRAGGVEVACHRHPVPSTPLFSRPGLVWRVWRLGQTTAGEI
jgi:hypothetical protein